ncbi:MAG: helix-turn-helix transcriptional regulator [Eikenella sp.]|nr:helix-turn-helix transcriptional regulator [Eikenella sp.]
MAEFGRFGADMGKTGKEALNQSVGQAVAKYRKAVGMTQAELAERLDLSLDAVSRLERGNIGLSVARLVELGGDFRLRDSGFVVRRQHAAEGSGQAVGGAAGAVGGAGAYGLAGFGQADGGVEEGLSSSSGRVVNKAT